MEKEHEREKGRRTEKRNHGKEMRRALRRERSGQEEREVKEVARGENLCSHHRKLQREKGTKGRQRGKECMRDKKNKRLNNRLNEKMEVEHS